jgi:putative PIN family toxin of toxin-antitoxin system
VKVVLDTDVLVSGLLTAEGPCGYIIELMIDGILQPCFDGRIYEEYATILHRPELAFDSKDADEILGVIRFLGEPVAAPPLQARLPDPSDLPFLEVARAAQAILVTGNRRHFPKKACKGVSVIAPRELLDIIRMSSKA